MAPADELTKALDAFYQRSLLPRFEKLDGRMDGFDGRMDKLETRVEQFASQVARRFQDLEARIEGVGVRLEAFRLEALDRFGDLYGKFGSRHDEYRLVVGALRRLEEAGTPGRPSEIADLAARLEEIERRLRAVEARRDGTSDR